MKRDVVNLFAAWALLPVMLGVVHWREQKEQEEQGRQLGQLGQLSKASPFDSLSPDHPQVRAAIDAANLPGARGRIDRDSSFTGTVSALYEAQDGSVRLLNFHPDYRRAIVAAVEPQDFARFGDLEQLVGQRVVMEGRFFLHKGRPEVKLASPEQIKVVR